MFANIRNATSRTYEGRSRAKAVRFDHEAGTNPFRPSRFPSPASLFGR
ncbi:hypothetical protein [Fulvimarina endophytica]|nr:hypothetical protein [Fulvimarina endophytica]